jgi:hypothetical protein
MRTEDGIWCDVKKCRIKAFRIHSCNVEQSEFAFCEQHNKDWVEKTRGTQQAFRCPRCLPNFLTQQENAANLPNHALVQLPPPIVGPLAMAIEDAMMREGVLSHNRIKVLQRLAACDDPYVSAIFRSTAEVTV